MKIYISNKSNNNIGGGFSFCRNFRKALKDKVQFVNTWQECDIFFVFGITTMDKNEVKEAVKAGKKLCLRADNIPKKSRNKRQSPVERLKEFGGLASCVVYQSEWSKDYAGYFIENDNELVINNGIDSSIFNSDSDDVQRDENKVLYINYNDNPNKRFEEALYRFELMWRDNNNLKLIIAGNIPRIYIDDPEFNWDLNVPAEVKYVGVMNTPEDVARLMNTCKYILFPAFIDSYPNTLLEALACGLLPVSVNPEGGAIEVLENSKDKVKTIEEMGDEYLEVFKKII